MVPERPPPPPPYRCAAPAGPRPAPAHWLRRARSRLRGPGAAADPPPRFVFPSPPSPPLSVPRSGSALPAAQRPAGPALACLGQRPRRLSIPTVTWRGETTVAGTGWKGRAPHPTGRGGVQAATAAVTGHRALLACLRDNRAGPGPFTASVSPGWPRAQARAPHSRPELWGLRDPAGATPEPGPGSLWPPSPPAARGRPRPLAAHEAGGSARARDIQARPRGCGEPGALDRRGAYTRTRRLHLPLAPLQPCDGLGRPLCVVPGAPDPRGFKSSRVSGAEFCGQQPRPLGAAPPTSALHFSRGSRGPES